MSGKIEKITLTQTNRVASTIPFEWVFIVVALAAVIARGAPAAQGGGGGGAAAAAPAGAPGAGGDRGVNGARGLSINHRRPPHDSFP